MSRSAIVTAAVRIADVDGVSALSMRRLATELDSGVMSLYRHVANKDALLTLITQAACDEHPYPEPAPPDWREAMRLAARLDWEVYCRHPWALVTSSSARHFSDTSCLDWMVDALTGLTEDPDQARSFSIAIWSYVQGVCIQHVAQQLLPGGEKPEQSPLRATEEDFETGLETLLDGMEQRAAKTAGAPAARTFSPVTSH
nr:MULTISPECIES: TetR/AcrR family transcriptional regulator [unclassified Streptomyces]